MTDRVVLVRQQGKLTMKGLRPHQTGVRIDMDRNERLTVTVDWSDWLNGDTITNVENLANSASIHSASNTTTLATLTVNGTTGRIDHRITTEAGLIKELHLYVNAGSFARDALV